MGGLFIIDTKMTETEAINHYCPKLPGWSDSKGLAQCHALYGLIVESKAKISVEVGVFGGQGLLAMLFAHRKLEQDGLPDTCAVGIDPWGIDAAVEGTNGGANDAWNKTVDWDKIYRDCMQNIADHHLMKWCRIHRDKSIEAAAAFSDGCIGVLHQDGNHSEEVTCAEAIAFAPKIKEFGYVVCDDINWFVDGKRTLDKAIALWIASGFVITSKNEGWLILQKQPKAIEPLTPAPEQIPVVEPPAEEVPERPLVIEPSPPEPTEAAAGVVTEPVPTIKKRPKKTDATKALDAFP